MNPNTKIFFNGKQLRTKQGKFKRQRGSFWLVAIALATYGMPALAMTPTTMTYVASDEVKVAEAAPKPQEAEAPILQRIADCESGAGKKGGAHQFNKDGSVVKHVNGLTYDIGYMQINSIHLADAMQLDFNLFTEEGNRAYGKWLYENRGTQDWNSSRPCWSR